jgi:hypothetical protein
MSEENSKQEPPSYMAEKSVTGKWVLKDGVPAWQEVTEYKTYNSFLQKWSKKRSEPVYKTPEEIGYFKECEVTILFKEERENLKKFRGKSFEWFKEVKSVSIREDRPHCWFSWEDGKLVIHDVWNQMSFAFIPQKSTPDVLVKDVLEEPELVSKTQLKTLAEDKSKKVLAFSRKDENDEFITDVS